MTVMMRDTRQAVLAEAAGWIGTPYRHQASRKGVGADCLGLVRGIWQALYGTDPEDAGPYAPDWAEAAGEDRLLMAARRHCAEIDLAEARPGDLLVFRWRPHMACKHVGILADGQRFIHAYQGSAVLASALLPQWRRRIAAAFGFPPLKACRTE